MVGPSNGRHTGNGDGRDGRGRFAKGNNASPGNPNIAQIGKLRARFFKAIRAKDVTQALSTIRSVMKDGRDNDRMAAARELLDRVLGKAVQSDFHERLEALEAHFAEGNRL